MGTIWYGWTAGKINAVMEWVLSIWQLCS